MKDGEGRIFECSKRRDMWKRLHLSKCERKGGEEIMLKAMGYPSFEDHTSVTDHLIRASIKAANDSLYH